MTPTVGSAEAVRDALLRQWQRIDDAIPSLDLETTSRVDGWRNREVITHLAMQPSLLVRFLGTASQSPPEISLASNLSGTGSLAELIDASVRQPKPDATNFGDRLRAARPVIESADLNVTVTTMQGSIALVDYLRTRCVEAVVHGGDLVPPVEPDDEAVAIAASALMELLATQHGDLVPAANALDPVSWLNQATGREEPNDVFADALPLMR